MGATTCKTFAKFTLGNPMSDEHLVPDLQQLIERASGRAFRDALKHALPLAFKVGGSLTERQIERLKWQKPVQVGNRKRPNPANTLWDPEHKGLHLTVSQRQGKVWKLRVRRQGEDLIRVLGQWPAMSVAEAVDAWTTFKETGRPPAKVKRQLRVKAGRGLLLSQLIEKFVDQYCNGKVPGTNERIMTKAVATKNAANLERFQEAFVETHGDLPVEDITAEHIRPVVIGFEEKREVERGGMKRVVGGPFMYNRVRSNVRTMQVTAQGGNRKLKLAQPWMSAAVENWTASLPKNAENTGRPLTDAELASFFKRVDTLGIAPGIVDTWKFLLLGGARIGETLAINLNDLHMDVDEPYVTIRPTKVDNTYDLPLSQQAATLINFQWSLELGHFIFTNPRTGTRYTAKSIQETLAAFRKDLGLGDDITPHAFRHTFVTKAAELGYGIEDRDAATGHVPSGSTDSRYSKTASRRPTVTRMVQDLADLYERLGMRGTDYAAG